MIRQFKNPMRQMKIIQNIRANKLLIRFQNQLYKREKLIKLEQSIEHKNTHKNKLYKKVEQ